MLQLNPTGGDYDVKALVVPLPSVNIYITSVWVPILCNVFLFNGTCLALFDWLVIQNRIVMLYSTLVYCVMYR